MDRETHPERLITTGMKHLSIAVASGFGAGYSPYAPGTCGSVVGLFVFWSARYILHQDGLTFQLVCAIFLIVAGIITADVTSRILHVKDPSLVVIDEIAGMFITLVGHEPVILHLLAGFVLFRILDIFKPFPIRQLERLKGGLGIMADDIMAGILANICLYAIPL
ncbi:MAG: phosphatidylglycerophosphatase A [Deltaproteobacteria bacterium]|jgi:phosphatidylglycerophosphatase A|nr:phosphatidylglycerophosphatase A [Deltaproteobacteria bacterium]